MRTAFCAGLVLVTLITGGHTRSVASQDVNLTGPQWLAYLPMYPHSYQTVVGVDPTGVTHIVRRENHAGIDVLRYLSSDREYMGTEGFTGPARDLDQSYADGSYPQDPDMFVDDQGNIYITWVHFYPNPDNLFEPKFSCVYYIKKTSAGWSERQLATASPSLLDTSYRNPKIAITSDGTITIVCHRTIERNGPPYFRRDSIVVLNGTFGGSFSEHILFLDAYPYVMRLASSRHKLGLAWEERTSNGSRCYFSVRENNTWSTREEYDAGVINLSPDISFDLSESPHLTWYRYASNDIWYRSRDGTASKVSNKPPYPHDLSRGTFIIVDKENVIHVFYSGLCHAYRSIGESNWNHQEPAVNPTASNDYMAILDDVAIGINGSLHVVSKDLYARTVPEAISMDGIHPIPAFPGGTVNIIDGSLLCRIDLFQMQGTGPSLSMGLNYNSRNSQPGAISSGWTLDYQMRVIDHGSTSSPSGIVDQATLFTPGGQAIPFTSNDALQCLTARSEYAFPGRLSRIDGKWAILMQGGMQYLFNTKGKLETVLHPSGNKITFVYGQWGYPTQIIDMLGNGGPGRVTQLNYEDLPMPNAGIHLTSIVDPAQRRYELGYSNGALSTITFASAPGRPTYKFDYERAWLMGKFIPPRGYAEYPQYGYKIEWTDAGQVSRIVDPPETIIPEGDDGTPLIANSEMLLKYCDPTAAQRRVIDRRGFHTIYTVDGRIWKVTEIWDQSAIAGAPGILPVRREYDIYGNILRETDRWGYSTRYTYITKSIEDPAPWLHNLLKTVEKQRAVGNEYDLLLALDYVTEVGDPIRNWGLVKSRTTYVTPTSGTTPLSRTTAFEYNSNGQLTVIHHPDLSRPDGVHQQDVTTRFYYDGPRRQLSRIENEEGHWTDYSNFHPLHGLPQSVLRQGGTEPSETRYDVMGNVTMTKAPQGRIDNEPPGWTINGLDGLYRVVTVTDPKGNVTVNGYDLESHLVSVTPPAGGPTLTFYDRRGFVSGGSSPDGSWSQWVDANGNVRRKSSLRGFDTHTKYDELGRAVETRAPGASTVLNGTGGGGPTMVTRFVHDGFGDLDGDGVSEHYSTETDICLACQPLTTPNPGCTACRTTRTVYDNRGRKVRVVAPDGKSVTENFYNELDQLVATQTRYDGAFQTCTVTYRDNRDRVERVRVQNTPYGAEPTQSSNTYTLYNKAGSVVQTVDPLGNVTHPGYAHKRTFILDARERVRYEIDGTGTIVKENVYGDDDLIVEVRLPDPEAKTDTLVPAEFRTYTARKELWTTRNRSGNGLSYAYNAIQGQVRTVTDAKGRVTETTYYPDTQRVDEVIVAKGTEDERRTKSVWEHGLLKETIVWNPAPYEEGGQRYNAAYRQYYDQADRLERFEAPLVAAEQHFYNEFGEESRFAAGLKIVDHEYTILGQRKKSTWTGAYSEVETRTYNGQGLLETVSAQGREKFMLYTPWLGTLSSETFSVGGAVWKSQGHAYDVAKNYTHFTDSENGLHEWHYDGNNRVWKLTFGGVTIYEATYTPGGLVDTTTLFDAAGQAIARTTHSYDGLGRKVRAQTVRLSPDGAGEVVADFGWKYDELDLVEKIQYHHLGVETVLGYNKRRELVSEDLTSNGAGAPPPWTNPPLGPPATGMLSDWSGTAKAVTTGPMAVAARHAEYAFDPAGNRIRQKIGTVEIFYHYNAASQLTEECPGSPTATPRVVHEYDDWGNEKKRTTTEGGSTTLETYGYNYLNLMSSYTQGSSASWQYEFWPTGERYAKTNLGTSASELYIPRGGDVATEYTRAGSGAPAFSNRYAQGTGIDQKYVRIPAGGTARRHYLGDQVGTVSVTLADDGGVAETSLKDAWGVQIAGAMSERYGYAHREHDNESGLVHMRARLYDPRRGRFTQIDPIIENRSTEHYLYVLNNPIINTDPKGESIWGVINKAYKAWKHRKQIAAAKEIIIETKKAAAKVAEVAAKRHKQMSEIEKKLADVAIDSKQKAELAKEWEHLSKMANHELHELSKLHTSYQTAKKYLWQFGIAIVAAHSAAMADTPEASLYERVSAGLWDFAKAVDPIFITDAVEKVAGVEEPEMATPQDAPRPK